MGNSGKSAPSCSRPSRDIAAQGIKPLGQVGTTLAPPSKIVEHRIPGPPGSRRESTGRNRKEFRRKPHEGEDSGGKLVPTALTSVRQMIKAIGLGRSHLLYGCGN